MPVESRKVEGMKNHGVLIIASVIALVLAVALSIRISIQKATFNRTVRDALETSEGYDTKFIDMVNKLEEELAMRASFGYKGQKDPMTGKVRTVVVPKDIRTADKTGKPQNSSAPVVDVVHDTDPIKLTAIIFDDEKKVHTAIVMDGERSYSVEMNDRLNDRKIIKITNELLIMESPTSYFQYDIFGNRSVRSKE